jgi:hypothetical protein
MKSRHESSESRRKFSSVVRRTWSASTTEEDDHERRFKPSRHCKSASQRVPWNKGKIIGAKPPLQPKHVWSIRTKLQVHERFRDLALFNLAIDSKLGGSDVVALTVDDIGREIITLSVPN